MKNFLLGIYLLLCLFLTFSCKDNEEPKGDIYVTVQNNSGRIANAQISTEPSTTTAVTDVTGTAFIQSIPIGGYKINAIHPDIGGGASPVTVTANEVVNVSISLPNVNIGGGGGGGGIAPYIDFQKPDENSVYDIGEEITFWAFVNDVDGDHTTLSVEWSSSLDGILFTGPVNSLDIAEFSTNSLSEGTHIINLKAMDADSLTRDHSISVEIKNFPDPVILESVENAPEGLILNWTASTDEYFSFYKILRSESSFGGFEIINNINDINQITYVDETGSIGVKYYYKVIVVNSFEESESNIESEVYEGEFINLGTGIVRMKLDKERPYIYGLDQVNNSLLFINKESKTLEKTIEVGPAPSDLSINLDNDKMYIANFGDNLITVIDLESQEKIDEFFVNTSAGSWDGNPYRIACLAGNRLVFTSEDQWNHVTIINANTGSLIDTYDDSISEPGLLTNSEQNILYVTESGSSGTQAYKLNLVGNNFALDNESTNYTNYDLRDASISGNDEFLFYLNQKLSADNLQNSLGTFGERIHACNFDGTIAVGSDNIWNAETFTIIKPLPLSSQIMLVDDTNLYIYNNTTSKIIILSTP